MLIAVRTWILLSVLLVNAGWILSAIQQLNRAGYLVIAGLAGGALLYGWCSRRGRAQAIRLPSGKAAGRLLSAGALKELLRAKASALRLRLRRRGPQLFLAIAALSFLSGCLYPALNYDANAYRLPRVMHWLEAGEWHWIHTFDARMNISACGMEWLSAPLILFTHTDRFLFLINWVSFLMLPGLLFSVFTRLQVRPRVAWWWMWILASGWCFALQASSIANDSFAAVYILAAVDLALRAREKKSVSDLWLSLLAAALCTGTKQTNLPLALLWIIAAWPSFPLFRTRPLRSVLVLLAGLLASLAPISLLNMYYAGSWLPVGNAGIASLGKFELTPFWGVIGNLFCLPVQNLVPPFFEQLPPFYSYWLSLWNEGMRYFLQTPLGTPFHSFENFGHLSGTYYHGISEGNAGLGLGICILIAVSLREAWRQRKTGPPRATVPRHKNLQLLRTVPWALLLVFMAKVGTFENARHLAPYYAFLFPALLVSSSQSQVVRRPPWQRLSRVMMGVTVALVAASGDRPLFPAQTLFSALRAKFPDNEWISEECGRYVDGGYRVTQARREYLQSALPPGESPVGYYALMFDVDEPGLWLPYGQRSVVCVSPDDSSESLRAQGVKYVVANGNALPQQSLDGWLRRYDASVVGQYTFHRPGYKPLGPDLYLLRLNGWNPGH